jgi:DNA replication protein DnaC
MLNKTTINHLHDLHLSAMAAKLVEIQDRTENDTLSFDERLALLVDAQWLSKQTKKINRLLVQAAFRFPAAIEDIDYQGKHGIAKQDIQRLAEGEYLRRKRNILLSGPTGVGKTCLVNALGRSACFQGHPVRYFRIPGFFAHLGDARTEGRYSKVFDKIAALPLLILDDWGLRKFTLEESHEIMELFERRYDAASTIIAGQLPCSAWHGLFPDPTLADAILDRVVHNAYKFTLSGDSMRKTIAEREA